MPRLGWSHLEVPHGWMVFVGHVQNPCNGLWQKSAIRQTFHRHVAVGGSLSHRRAGGIHARQIQTRPWRPHVNECNRAS